jgi:hypothetical protein
MQCRDVRELADSYVDGELSSEESRELVRHLADCPACREDVETRRALKAGVQRGFRAATELAPTAQYLAGLRTRLESEHASRPRNTWAAARVWALAAALVVAAAASLVVLHRGAILDLARAAVGDHRNCALEFKLAEAPITLEEAARRYGPHYRVLESVPSAEVHTTAGPARVVARHSCVYLGRRFAHVVFDYRGVHVSLLVTDRRGAARLPVPGDRPASADGMPVVSFETSRHVAFITGAVAEADLRALADAVAKPLREELERV